VEKTSESHQRFVLVVDQNRTASAVLAKALERASYRVAGPFTECSDASEWLNGARPDGAFLNALLTDDTCFSLGRQLRSLDVPYLFHSGWEQPNGNPDLVVPEKGHRSMH
jgi:DNA-binding response OmpR family regulator